MEKFYCENMTDINDFFECETCGNHICKTKAELLKRVCPHCFGRLYRIS